MKHSLLALGLLLILFGPVASSAHAAEENTSTQLRIGVILPLTGASSNIGQRLQNAVKLAHDRLPDDLRSQVVLLFEDDSWNAARAVSAFTKLADIDKVHAALVIGSASGRAVAPLAEKRGIVLIAVGASDINVVKGRKFAFLNWVTPEAEAEMLVAEVKRRNYNHLALVISEQDGMIAISNAVREEFARQGLSSSIVLDERFLSGETDYRTFISKARSKKIDAAVLFLMSGAISSFAKQNRSLRLNAALCGVELFEDDNEVKASEGTLLGQWYVTAKSAREFDDEFSRKFGERAAFGAPNAYDAVNLLVEGFRKFGRDGNKLAEFLATLKDYSGAAGIYSATGDNRFTLPAAVRVVTEKGYQDLQ